MKEFIACAKIIRVQIWKFNRAPAPSERVFDNKEQIIKGDWLNSLNDYSFSFHLILSDLTSGNIPYESREHFYSSISKLLVKDGLFIDKVLTHDIPNLVVSDLEKKYNQVKGRLLVCFFRGTAKLTFSIKFANLLHVKNP